MKRFVLIGFGTLAVASCKTSNRNASLAKDSTASPAVVGNDLGFSNSEVMTIERLKKVAFDRCQAPRFVKKTASPLPMLDPPQFHPCGTEMKYINGKEAPLVMDEVEENGQKVQRPRCEFVKEAKKGPGIDYNEELAIQAKHDLYAANDFFMKVKPRVALLTDPIQIFLRKNGQNEQDPFILQRWEDSAFDFSAPVIDPPINPDDIPASGRYLTNLLIGHRTPQGGYPTIFDLRSNAYLRFQGYDQVPGASFRLAAHGIFGKESTDEAGNPYKNDEDFPVLLALFTSIQNNKLASAFALVESDLLCGALRLDMSPDSLSSSITVDGYWYNRRDFKWRDDPNTALAAYSSMFWRHETRPGAGDAAHDSDTIRVIYGDNSQDVHRISVPIQGMRVTEVSKDADRKSPVEWRLANEDRDASHYRVTSEHLKSSAYHLRSSYGVRILDSNVKTSVRIVEHRPEQEYLDNIVGLSAIRQDISKIADPSKAIHFKYRTWSYNPQGNTDR